jgi:CheY-like chemotaxis protein
VPPRANSSRGDGAEPRELLATILASAYGSSEDAQAVIDHALEDGGRAELPDTGPELLTFVRAHLVPILSIDIGPRLTMALLDDFIKKYEVRSGVRGKEAPDARRRSVILVDPDRIGRPVIARALLRAGCHVMVIESARQLEELVADGETVDVAVVDVMHPARLSLLESIVERFPEARLVVRSDSADGTRDLLHGLGATRFEVFPRHTPARVLVNAATG